MLERRTVRGVRLAFEWVDAGAELIVFIHGVGADRCSWIPQVKFFSQLGYSVAAVDMRGSGESQARLPDGLALPITIEDFASDVDALVSELGFESATWVGNSMGGVITMSALSVGMKTISRAVLCNTFACHPDSKQILPRASAALRTTSLEAFARVRIPQVLRPDVERSILQDAIESMAQKDPETYLLSWRETWSKDYRGHLAGVTVPTLVITGTLDKITPPALGEEIAALLPQSRYVAIEGAGHLSNLDQPDEFNRVLYEFLSN